MASSRDKKGGVGVEEKYEGKIADIFLHKGIGSIPYRLNQIFNNVFCGIIAGIIFYLLSNKINLYNPLEAIRNLSFLDIVLFFIALTGYIGILPRAIWFWSYSGKLSK